MRRHHLYVAPFVTIALSALTIQSASAQKVDYHKADLIRVSSVYAAGTNVSPNWLEDSIRFWYTSRGKTDRNVTYLVDPRGASRRILFDNARLAAALSIATDTILDPTRLPGFKVVDNATAIEVSGGGGGFFGGGAPSPFRKQFWRCELASYKCTPLDSTEYVLKAQLKSGPSWATRSPDKKWDVFMYNYNLYMRPASTSDAEATAAMDSVRRARGDTAKKKTPAKPKDSVALPSGSVQLTTDGEKLNDWSGSWRDDDTPRFKPQRVSLIWAPNSQRFAVQRNDLRKVRRYPIYSSTGDQPVDKSYVYAAASDSVIIAHDVYAIDLVDKTIAKVQQPPSPSLNHSSGGQWNRESDRLFVVTSSRGFRGMIVNSVDPKTGATKAITRDSFPTWIDFRGNWVPAFKIVNNQDVFWMSDRDGWSHIYRYGFDGTFKKQVTSGPWRVEQTMYDTAGKRIFFRALGLDPANPYYGRIYRVGFDGGPPTLLTPESADHSMTFVPKGPYFIDSYSRPDTPPITVLRSSEDGRVIMELARGDVEYLRSIGWTPPETFVAKARDGVTDIWGLLYKPSNFDPSKSYPIIDNIYPGPQVGSIRSFDFAGTDEVRAIAELGFIVVQVNSLGTPGRSKAFQDYYYGKMGDNGIPDHVAAIRQLAAKYSWIDINRVGIFGHSGGGYASTGAIFRHPDFFKVAVSGSGNHHPNTYGYHWGEKYQGPYNKAAYDEAANYTHAKNLKGKLLIMHGDMDTNVHPANTLRVVDALIKANKNFDMIIYPDAGHGLPDHHIRKRWDYFVKHLMGAEPPDEYTMLPSRF
jgi:dipeptidyl aminopeptidase/acylaminoacyl peptidase